MIEHNLVPDIPPNQRLSEAVGYYKRAAEKNNSEAMTDLGFLFEKGFIGMGDEGLDKAQQWYRAAIENHNPRAMNNLAGLYLSGNFDAFAELEIRNRYWHEIYLFKWYTTWISGDFVLSLRRLGRRVRRVERERGLLSLRTRGRVRLLQGTHQSRNMLSQRNLRRKRPNRRQKSNLSSPKAILKRPY